MLRAPSDSIQNLKRACSEFHRKKLARRLLNAGQVEQQEQTFLSRLKQQCGAQFTQKMEGMNNDLATAREKQAEFQTWLGDKVDLQISCLDYYTPWQS